MKPTFSFIHAADLHLDAAFKGVANVSPRLAGVLQSSTFEALERLTQLACSERPLFVVLVGDIYNQEDQSLKARFALLDACKRMRDVGVRVFIVHGNHDPLQETERSFSFPENVHVFGTDGVEQVRIEDAEGELVTVVHGVSHGKHNERRKLARLYSRTEDEVVQVAVLHCTVDSVAASEQYAPASVADFAKSGIEYWALGHIHEQQVVSREPFVAYSGNIQGLHINEQGERGCLMVTVADGQISTEHYTLGVIQWKIEKVDISAVEKLDMLEEVVESRLEDLVQQLPENCKGVIVRLVLEGRSVLDGELRKNGAVKEFADRIREGQMENNPFVWLKDIELACKPDVDIEAMRSRPDLLGEALTVAEQLTSEDGAGELREAVSELFSSPTSKRHLTILSDEELTQLATEAQYVCLDLLEAE
ncbi:metallophosphoesterase family protein [Halodesulfovibrio marinisediminis]|uniref:DNA repair exonuclease SbcCD nuclease subunit n=1 Tax=Halodesulfovibrio marinisediminis DSM 17456 TaxID=1121457 RepID=A0A1N6EW84_9BACT|nr:DNA repair exonuclease [Halodesulfovibrio marinisediminis]SIN87211.1 DNA repair exonuclease SbcCD nuclease subunit [Halodesulfovibrio marinisediminis DSM 17456]